MLACPAVNGEPPPDRDAPALDARRRGQSRRLLWTLAVLVALLAAAFFGGLYTVRWLGEGAAAAGGRAFDRLESLARAFRTGTVTTTFLSYATEVAGVRRLQVAQLTQMELFERSDRATALWGTLELPELVVRATAPVEYTYYVDFDEPWELALTDGRIEVQAPALRWNRPALDVSRLDYEVRRGSLLRDEAEAFERLRRGLGRMAEGRARDNLPLVREVARRQIAEFVAAWLARSFEDGAGVPVEVRFADERPGLLPGAPELVPRRAPG